MSERTDTPMGSIMTAVAVLETHMERKPVAIMKPRTSSFGEDPMATSTHSATRRCRFQRCMARASRKPPMNRKMVGAVYCPEKSPISAMLSMGNSTSGSSAVTEMGMASDIHQAAMSTAMAAVPRSA